MSTAFVELRAPAVSERGVERKKADTKLIFWKRLSISKLEANVNSQAFAVPFGEEYTADRSRIMSDNVNRMKVEFEPPHCL